mgnify:CR=1 FL=1
MEQQIKELQDRVNKLEGLLYKFALTDRYMFSRNIQMQDGRSITLGTTTGTRIGIIGGASGEKIGLWGAVPVVQPTGVAVSAAGIHAALVSIGIITA